jgi:stearoyl-CoA desaturase (Delta-9 desaturase)
MMLMGSGAVEGSLRWWARDHRAHHKYVDTDYDPYSSKKGFFYSHMGWMLVRQDKEKIGRVNISDLEDDPMVMFQHRNYPWFGERKSLPWLLRGALTCLLIAALGMGIVLPTVVCGLGWGDWYGGYFIAAVARLVFVHHSTFCVNSLAHWAGEQGFSDAHTSRDSVITAVVTLGEGYHNFHHEFPNDYRNAIRWWQYDPTKWLIAFLGWTGLAYDLHEFDSDLIQKNMVQMQAKKLNWGKDASVMESLTMKDVEKRVADGSQLVVLDGFAIDLAGFVESHPGGPGYIKKNLGKDCTRMMRGDVYKHSNAAHNMTLTRRVGFVVDAPSFEYSSQALRAAAIHSGKKPHSY